jgi:hypothetical protein
MKSEILLVNEIHFILRKGGVFIKRNNIKFISIIKSISYFKKRGRFFPI